MEARLTICPTPAAYGHHTMHGRRTRQAKHRTRPSGGLTGWSSAQYRQPRRAWEATTHQKAPKPATTKRSHGRCASQRQARPARCPHNRPHPRRLPIAGRPAYGFQGCCVWLGRQQLCWSANGVAEFTRNGFRVKNGSAFSDYSNVIPSRSRSITGASGRRGSSKLL